MTPALAALALLALPSQPLATRAGPYELQLLVQGTPARTFLHDGEAFVLGHLGERYTLRVLNRSGRRVEAVVSVDGRDVIDGNPADWRTKRGYLVPAFGSVDIDGWRLSQEQAAAFRFSSVRDSYAARTGNGREVGVIGVAVFPERWSPRPLPIEPEQGARPESGLRQELDREGSAGTAPRPEAEDNARAATPSPLARKSVERRGLGTEFGEPVWSQVHDVPFERASERPRVLIGVRYDDRAGLVALGIDVDTSIGEADLRRTAEPFPVVERDYATPPPGWRH